MNNRTAFGNAAKRRLSLTHAINHALKHRKKQTKNHHNHRTHEHRMYESVGRKLNNAISNSNHDPMNMESSLAVARVIARFVADKETLNSTFMKAGRAVATRRVPVGEMAEVLESIIANRARIQSPGRYFVACLKRLFLKHEVPW